MELKCQKCDHEWNYSGESEYYATCPKCYRKVNIKKLKKKTERRYEYG